MDCAPVEHVYSGSFAMVVTTKQGTVVVPATFPRRESKDNRMHVCMRRDETGKMKLLCLFLPPAS